MLVGMKWQNDKRQDRSCPEHHRATIKAVKEAFKVTIITSLNKGNYALNWACMFYKLVKLTERQTIGKSTSSDYTLLMYFPWINSLKIFSIAFTWGHLFSELGKMHDLGTNKKCTSSNSSAAFKGYKNSWKCKAVWLILYSSHTTAINVQTEQKLSHFVLFWFFPWQTRV